MSGIAPFIARPGRRLAAGSVDFVLAMTAAVLLISVVHAADYATDEMRSALIIYGAYHAISFSVWDGQTPGLRTFDIRAVSRTGGIALSTVQIGARCFARPALLYFLGWLGSRMMIPTGVLAVIIAATVLAELGMMFTLPTRQTLADLLSRTLVVNVPPPQPHRAPAAPMYSATDAEFGLRPRRLK